MGTMRGRAVYPSTARAELDALVHELAAIGEVSVCLDIRAAVDERIIVARRHFEPIIAVAHTRAEQRIVVAQLQMEREKLAQGGVGCRHVLDPKN